MEYKKKRIPEARMIVCNLYPCIFHSLGKAFTRKIVKGCKLYTIIVPTILVCQRFYTSFYTCVIESTDSTCTVVSQKMAHYGLLAHPSVSPRFLAKV